MLYQKEDAKTMMKQTRDVLAAQAFSFDERL
jgi:hypothetical protein